jgi:D-xylose transport system substrate-binding protein
MKMILYPYTQKRKGLAAMNNKKACLCLISLSLLVVLMCACGCGRKKDQEILIGLSLDTLAVERWQRDADLFRERAEQLGAKVLVQSANGDPAVQNEQAENMLTRGVDVLVVVPQNAETSAVIVESAHKQKPKVPVIGYDRIIRNCDLDVYISFDNVRVGELQAEYLVRKAPKGNYFLLGGASTDENSKQLREGQLNVLQPFFDRGDIEDGGRQWCRDWDPLEALHHIENALTRLNNRIDAVVASNDGTAGGAIQALAAQKLAGKVAVSGQDADLAACQRIVEGTQTMTVYKPIKRLAYRAAEIAVAMAKGEEIGATTRTVFNGKKNVPSVLLEPIAVDRDNLYEAVIKDGYHKVEEVYRNVPRDQWPKPSGGSQ